MAPQHHSPTASIFRTPFPGLPVPSRLINPHLPGFRPGRQFSRVHCPRATSPNTPALARRKIPICLLTPFHSLRTLRYSNMTDSLKLRALSGWSILLLGVLLFVTSFMPAVLRGGISPTAGMIGLFGLLAIGVGIALSVATEVQPKDGAVRRLCVALMSLTFAAAGGGLGILVQRTTFFDGLGSLHAMLVIMFAALFGFAALACVATARQGTSAFISPSQSFFSLGGTIDPLSFLLLQPALLIFAAVVGGMIATQVGGSREGLLLAIALALAVLPFFITVELAICIRRWRATTAAWQSYGVLVWAALLGLITFHEIFQWVVSLPGVLLSSSPLPPWPHVSLVRVLCYLLSLAACISCFIASRRPRRGFFLRVPGYVALGIGSLMPLSVGLASESIQQASATPIAIVFAVFFVVAGGLITGAHFLVFRRDEKVAA